MIRRCIYVRSVVGLGFGSLRVSRFRVNMPEMGRVVLAQPGALHFDDRVSPRKMAQGSTL